MNSCFHAFRPHSVFMLSLLLGGCGADATGSEPAVSGAGGQSGARSPAGAGRPGVVGSQAGAAAISNNQGTNVLGSGGSNRGAESRPSTLEAGAGAGGPRSGAGNAGGGSVLGRGGVGGSGGVAVVSPVGPEVRGGSATLGGRAGTDPPNSGSAAGGRGSATGGRAGTAGAASGPITVWVAGDSTVANGQTPCPAGWAGQFKSYFNDKITVNNRAAGGRSVQTWLYNVLTTTDAKGECNLTLDATGQPVIQSAWKDMLAGMKAGDYLFIQFGINDGSATCDRHVGLATFKASYGMMAKAAKERGAQPVFLTPVSAIACTGSTPKGTRGGFVTATQEAGKEFDVPVIDLHALSVALYQSLNLCPIPGGDVSATTTGPVGEFFCDDHTHFDKTGAAQIAGLVASALKTQGLGLAGYLKQ